MCLSSAGSYQDISDEEDGGDNEGDEENDVDESQQDDEEGDGSDRQSRDSASVSDSIVSTSSRRRYRHSTLLNIA